MSKYVFKAARKAWETIEQTQYAKTMIVDSLARTEACTPWTRQ